VVRLPAKWNSIPFGIATVMPEIVTEVLPTETGPG
jgi:hypothetical protein